MQNKYYTQLLHNMEAEYTLRDEDTGTYYLSIIKNERKYCTTITNLDFCSAFVDICDFNKLLKNEKIDGILHSCQFSENDEKTEMMIEIEISFQKLKSLKRISESFAISLQRVKRDIYMEEIIKLKNDNKRLRSIVESSESKYESIKRECAFLKSAIHLITGKYDSTLESFKVNIKVHNGSIITDKKCIEYITGHPRFKKYKVCFKITKQEDDSNYRITSVHAGFNDWLFHPYHTGIVSFELPFQTFEEAKQRISSLEKNGVEFKPCITLYELIAQYQLRNKILLPGSCNGYSMRQVDSSEFINEFNIMELIESPQKLQDRELYWNPTVGFYETITNF